LSTVADKRAEAASDSAAAEADFNRRLAREQDVVADEGSSFKRFNAVFDGSGQFIAYATMLGIKFVNLTTNRVSRVFSAT
jgi:peptidylprolyl isomerase domain and WD repeat-containing protein 1